MSMTFLTPKLHHNHRLSARPMRVLSWTILASLLCLVTLSLPIKAAAETPTIDAELELHKALIETALSTDFYNKRCRGISIAKALNQVNRLMVTKYSLTANKFIQTYISKDVRQMKSLRQHEFNQQLAGIGGCQAAKSQGWVKQLQTQFKKQYEHVEKSSWYPE